MRHTILSAVASFIQVQQYLTSLFINHVKSDHLYDVWQTNNPNNTRPAGSEFLAPDVGHTAPSMMWVMLWTMGLWWGPFQGLLRHIFTKQLILFLIIYF